MLNRRVVHSTVVAEQPILVAPGVAFRAWGAPDAHRVWHTPGEGWDVLESERDFVVGGRDYCRFGPDGEGRYHSEGRFLVIEPDRRVVSSGTMFDCDAPTASTLCTVEFVAAPGGVTLVVVTDQSAYFDGRHDPLERAEGWKAILAKFGDGLA